MLQVQERHWSISQYVPAGASKDGVTYTLSASGGTQQARPKDALFFSDVLSWPVGTFLVVKRAATREIAVMDNLVNVKALKLNKRRTRPRRMR